MSLTNKNDGSEPLTLERFANLVESYGGRPALWPHAERDGALRLLEESQAARALRDVAIEIDHFLDAAPDDVVSPELGALVLAAAPRKRRPAVWKRVWIAAVPMAAAAAIALWLTSGGNKPEITLDAASMQVGEYTSATDALLGSYGVDVSEIIPSVGCSDSELGCPNVELDGQQQSRRLLTRRYYA